MIDLAKAVRSWGSIDTLKSQGFNPNCIMLPRRIIFAESRYADVRQ